MLVHVVAVNLNKEVVLKGEQTFSVIYALNYMSKKLYTIFEDV